MTLTLTMSTIFIIDVKYSISRKNVATTFDNKTTFSA